MPTVSLVHLALHHFGTVSFTHNPQGQPCCRDGPLPGGPSPRCPHLPQQLLVPVVLASRWSQSSQTASTRGKGRFVKGKDEERQRGARQERRRRFQPLWLYSSMAVATLRPEQKVQWAWICSPTPRAEPHCLWGGGTRRKWPLKARSTLLLLELIEQGPQPLWEGTTVISPKCSPGRC